MTTRKQLHAQAVEMLATLAADADQVHALLQSARTIGAVETGCGPYRVTASHRMVGILEELHAAAKETTCEDCGALIADCSCEWANSEVRRG